MRIGFYNLINGAVVRTHQIETEIDSAVCQVSELVGLQRPDLILLNDDDLTYAKIRLDAKSLVFAKEHLSEISDPLARAQIWLSMWNAARDGMVPPRDFINFVLAHIANEDQSMLVTSFLGYLTTFVFQYTAAENREATIDEVAEKFWQLINSAKPSSDIQLQLVNFYGRFARTAVHQENIKGILSGQIVVAGLDLGHDVRWELITGLAAGGAISQAEIDAEYATDSTANGQKGQASAGAALALADSKWAVWSKLVDTDEYSNAQSAAASLAFGRALKPELLAPFVDRYFADAEKIWETKTYKMAEYLLQRLFPINLATRELAERTRAYLAANTHFAPAMRRMIVENLSRLDRALAAQALDKK